MRTWTPFQQPSITHGPQKLRDFCAISRPMRYLGASEIRMIPGM